MLEASGIRNYTPIENRFFRERYPGSDVSNVVKMQVSWLAAGFVFSIRCMMAHRANRNEGRAVTKV